jgi:hypothetical protein
MFQLTTARNYQQFTVVFDAIRELVAPEPDEPAHRIGFGADTETSSRYDDELCRDLKRQMPSGATSQRPLQRKPLLEANCAKARRHCQLVGIVDLPMIPARSRIVAL